MIVEVTSITQPGLDVFTSLTEAQLRRKDGGLFIAESPKVIRVALDHGYHPLSMLCERRHIEGDAADIIRRCPEMSVYTGDRGLLADITGYTLTRGVLCAIQRPGLPSVGDICRDANRVAVIDGVCDTTNIGAIFRSAAALGIDGVLVTSSSCDPFNRRAVRVSMGTVFSVPWTWLDDPVSSLGNYGFRTVAMALTLDSVAVDDPCLKEEPRLAIVLGTEGDGLAEEVISSCDYVARIPMEHGVDSLNVAAASAVAFWELRNRK